MKMSDQTHFQKVVTVPQGDKNERVFLIGGSSDDQGNHAVDTCTELVYSKKKPHLQDITSMLVPRLSFCSCVSQDGTKIYTAGGISENKKPTNDVEVYDIKDNTWSHLPNLNQPRFSASIIQSGDALYCFGGQDTDQQTKHFSLSSIEYLDLSQSNAQWEVLGVDLPWKSCSPGAIQTKKNEILIFGGWDQDVKRDSCYIRGKKDGGYSIAKGPQLKVGDTFLLQGIRKRNVDAGESVIFGHEEVHLYNEVEQKFYTL